MPMTVEWEPRLTIMSLLGQRDERDVAVIAGRRWTSSMTVSAVVHAANRSVLPPFMIIVTAGLFTGVFVMALMLPMIKLIEGLSK